MVYIKKMRLRGFKSFANPIDLEFGRNFNVVLGPNGSGKCLTFDENVQLADGSIRKIGELVEEKFRKNDLTKIDDGYIIKGDDTKILSLNPENLKIAPKKVYAYIKRESPEYLIRIRTRAGREITATEYHPLFIFENEKIRSVKAEELKEGIKIAVARKIPTKPETKYFYELMDLIAREDEIYVPWKQEFSDALKCLKKKTWKSLAGKIKVPYNSIKGVLDKQAINFFYLIKILRKAELNNDKIIRLINCVKSKNGNRLCRFPWENTESFSRFLGYLLAEGRISESNQIWFTNGTQEIAEDYAFLARNLFGISPSIKEYKPNCWDILIYSHPLIRILTKFGMSLKGTGGKNVSNLFLSHADDKELCSLLNGLYCGDGHISKQNIEIVTKSKNLGFAIENILSRLGITYNSSYIVKVAANSGFSGIYRRIIIYGVENFIRFYTNIKLIHNHKRKKLENLLGLKSNPNLDLIEVNNLIKGVTKELNLNIKKLKKEFPRLDSYCYNQCTPSVIGVKHLIENLFEPAAKGKNCCSLMLLKTLSTSDIYWDEIVSLDRIKSDEKWVYDLSIEKNHNFIANNIIVHNSNIMDAMCFVLGEISAKSMRAEKSSNLIFNGGKKGSPAKEAEVSIYFDNSEKMFPVNNDEVKVSRVVRQNGNSIYKINDEARTRQEVKELLGKARIDSGGHNIILQGDIVHFMEMRADERRQIIEEVSGISVYEEKKHQSLNELNNVEQKLNEVSIIMKEREAHLRELKKDRDQALKYREYETTIRQNKATYLHMQINEKIERKEDIEKRISKEQSEIDSINSKISDTRKKISESKETLAQLNLQIEEKGEKEQILLQKEVEDLRTGIAGNNVRFDGLKNEVSRIKQRKEQILKEQNEVGEKIKSLEAEKIHLEEEIKTFSREEKIVVKKINDFKEKHNVYDSAEKLGDEINNKQGEVFSLKDKKQELSLRAEELKAEIRQIDSLLGLENDPKVKKLAVDLKTTEKDLEDSLANLSAMNSQLTYNKKLLSENTIEYSKLNEKQVSLEIYSSSINKIIGLKKQGVYGTVSQLGKVDSKYALALEIAAGARIQSVVVSNENVAIDCIKILKKDKMGAVTFLPLNKIKQWKKQEGISELLNKEDVVGLAVDLVKHDIKFDNIFSYVFGSTLVVKDSSTARKIGIGRARMVTLDGDLFEISGSITGGYRRKIGSFKETGFDAKISKIENEISRLKECIACLNNDINSGEENCRKLRGRKAILEAEILKIQKTTEVKDLEKLKKNKLILDGSLKEIEKNIRGLEENLDNDIKELDTLKAKRQKMSNVDSGIIGGLKELEDKRLELSNKITELQVRIKNIVTQTFTIYKPELDKILKILKQNEKEFNDFSNESARIEKGLEKARQDLKLKEKEEKVFHSEFKAMFVKRNSLNDDIAKLENNISNEDFKIREIEKKINEINLKRAKIAGELEGIQLEFEEFKNEKIRRNISVEDLKNEIYKCERFMKDLGNVNLRALEIYEAVSGEYLKLQEKISSLRAEKEDVLKMMVEIEKNKKKLFMKAFNAISENFKKIFMNLSEKGDAYLEVENKDEPFSGGLDIKVRLIGNKFLDIKSLSGGEKTLTALAFIFAIQEYSPASFYLLDEVDAALDKTNSVLLSRLVQKYSRNAQYVLVSHNDNIITEADQIYGVSMQRNGISKIVSLKI